MWDAKDRRAAAVKRSACELRATGEQACDAIIRAATMMRASVGAHVAVVMDPVVVQQAAGPHGYITVNFGRCTPPTPSLLSSQFVLKMFDLEIPSALVEGVYPSPLT